VKEISFGKKGYYVMVSSKVFKDMLQDLRSAKRIILPRDISEEYKRHIECEQKRTVINKETGAEEMMWVPQKKDDNHLFDCLYYNVASAYIMGVFGESYEEKQDESTHESHENSD
jgi:phage terminase large subunit GpA-like protein